MKSHIGGKARTQTQDGFKSMLLVIYRKWTKVSEIELFPPLTSGKNIGSEQ